MPYVANEAEEHNNLVQLYIEISSRVGYSFIEPLTSSSKCMRVVSIQNRAATTTTTTTITTI